MSFFFFLPFLVDDRRGKQGTGCAGQGGWGRAAASSQLAASAWNGWRREEGALPWEYPPPTTTTTAAPYHPAWGETNTGSSFEKGEFPWISPSCVDKQTDTLIESEREAERERKRRGPRRNRCGERIHHVPRPRRLSDCYATVFGSKFFICGSETRRHGLSQWGIYNISDSVPVSHGAVFKPCTTRDVFHHITECAGFSSGHA